jgi:hypothetical protein
LFHFQEVFVALALAHRQQLQQGLACLEAGRTDEGAGILANLAADHPNHPPCRLFFGIALWDQDQPAQALKEIEATLALDPANSLARSWHALALAATGQWTAARRVWTEHGHHANSQYRVRVTEWIELIFLKANGWPHLPRPETPPAAEPTEPGESPAGIPPQNAERVPWDPALYAIAPHPGPDLEDPPTNTLGWWAYQRLYRRVERDYASYRFDAVLPAIAPLLGNSRCTLATLVAAANVAHLTGHASIGRKLCERVQPMDQWPDPLRALYSACLYREGHHAESAQALIHVHIRGPEDYGAHWTMGGLALAQNDRMLARRLFNRSHTSYMVDTLVNQWWAVEQALLRGPIPTDGTYPSSVEDSTA